MMNDERGMVNGSGGAARLARASIPPAFIVHHSSFIICTMGGGTQVVGTIE
jgi:hypothetical protein